MTADPIKFPSRIDAWLAAAVLLAFGVVLYQGFSRGDAIAFAVALFMGLLLLSFLPCTYTLTADHLLIRAGLRRWQVPYREIRSIELSRNPLAAPALSLRRVRIDYGRRFALVSPREREAFVQALRERVEAARRPTR